MIIKQNGRFEYSNSIKQVENEIDFSMQHGPGNTTCFGVEPFPTVMDQFDYRMQKTPKPIPIKVWADYRETDSIAIRLIQLKKVFEQNPALKLSKANVDKALEWLKKYFP